MQLPHLDLQLLVQLDVLMKEAHVTRAAEKLGMSQPQMSAALARLRKLFNDPLLVRTASGMVPTPRGVELTAEVRMALRHLQTAMGGGGAFDPASSHRSFRIAVSESLSRIFLPALMARLQREAPATEIVVRMPLQARLRDWLEAGEVDMAIGYYRGIAEGLHASSLLQQPLCVIARRRHPFIEGKVSLQQFVQARHVFFGSDVTTTSTIERCVDEALAEQGMGRQVGCRLPSPMLSPQIVACTDMVATVSRRLAQEAAQVHELQLLELPLALPSFDMAMVWHARHQRDAGHQWLRAVLRQICAAA